MALLKMLRSKQREPFSERVVEEGNDTAATEQFTTAIGVTVALPQNITTTPVIDLNYTSGMLVKIDIPLKNLRSKT